MITFSELSEAILKAAREAIVSLFRTHPEQFYYLVLATTGEALPPVLSAWSIEAIEAAVKGENDREDAIRGLKWSYADSPYFDFGSAYFSHVRDLFFLRPDIPRENHDARQIEYDFRLDAMEFALAALDAEGLFGKGDKRARIMINVEVNPPDYTNTIRAKRLNPPEAIAAWLLEMAEGT